MSDEAEDQLPGLEARFEGFDDDGAGRVRWWMLFAFDDGFRFARGGVAASEDEARDALDGSYRQMVVER